jgi:lysozyme
MNLIPNDMLQQEITKYLMNSAYISEFPPEGPVSIGLQESASYTSYQDSLGNWTIGLGHTPAYPNETWSLETMMSVFFNDIYAKGYSPIISSLPWVKSLSQPRQWVNYNASFNMGSGNWLQFSETLQAMQSGNLIGVLEGMMNSQWYNQVPNRVKALMYQYYFDVWVLGYLDSSQLETLDSIINSLGVPNPTVSI